MTRHTAPAFALILPLFLALAACEPSFHPADRVDADGDGFFAPAAGAVDGFFVCRLVKVDGVLQLVQAGDTSLLVEDVSACLTISELEARRIDCDDSEDDRFPGAAEVCDGNDNDCDNALDASEDDADGDGYTECGYDPATGVVTLDRDCNDDSTVLDGSSFPVGAFQNPGLTEVCGMPPNAIPLGAFNSARPQYGLDDDCDGETYAGNDPSNPGIERDIDSDGHAQCELQVLVDPNEDPTSRARIAPDCDDGAATVNPSIGVSGTGGEDATVSCVEGRDFDSACVPASQSQNIEKILWAPDSDHDGDGAEPDPDNNADNVPDNYEATCATGTEFSALDASPSWLNMSSTTDPQSNTDCDDLDARQEGLDVDGDGFSTCEGDFYPGFTSADEEPLAFPGASESCDQIDNDLDGATDEAFDSDGDGAFDPASCSGIYGAELLDCDDSSYLDNQLDVDQDGNSTCAGDCNDFNPLVTALDSDGDGSSTCDGDCDDSDATLNTTSFDGDGFSTCDGDCDDTDADIYPGAPLTCAGDSDDNCDGAVDANMADADGDGDTVCDGDCDDGDAGLTVSDGDGDGYSSCAGDCADGDSNTHPGAPPVCGDGVVDNDCNGMADPNEADLDNDGDTLCDGDCSDTDSTLNLTDSDGDGDTTCDGDCDDGDATLNLADADGDGWPTCAIGPVPGDCDDNDSGFNPGDSDGDGASTCGADAIAATADDDCDDNDAAQNPNDEDGDGQTSCDGDCDDDEASVSSTSSEGLSADGLDNDCDGIADESLISVGDLAVVEIMISAAAATTDGFGEYIEVYNAEPHDIDLRGWIVDVTNHVGSSTTFTFPSPIGADEALIVPAGARAVLARSTNASGYGLDIADVYWAAPGFDDQGGSVELIFGSLTIDQFAWDPSGCNTNCSTPTFPATFAGPGYWRSGRAMGLKTGLIGGSSHSSNDSPSNWCEEGDILGANGDHGSPGLAPSLTGTCG